MANLTASSKLQQLHSHHKRPFRPEQSRSAVHKKAHNGPKDLTFQCPWCRCDLKFIKYIEERHTQQKYGEATNKEKHNTEINKKKHHKEELGDTRPNEDHGDRRIQSHFEIKDHMCNLMRNESTDSTGVNCPINCPAEGCGAKLLYLVRSGRRGELRCRDSFIRHLSKMHVDENPHCLREKAIAFLTWYWPRKYRREQGVSYMYIRKYTPAVRTKVLPSTEIVFGCRRKVKEPTTRLMAKQIGKISLRTRSISPPLVYCEESDSTFHIKLKFQVFKNVPL